MHFSMGPDVNAISLASSFFFSTHFAPKKMGITSLMAVDP
jgi:hypothetical protein